MEKELVNCDVCDGIGTVCSSCEAPTDEEQHCDEESDCIECPLCLGECMIDPDDDLEEDLEEEAGEELP